MAVAFERQHLDFVSFLGSVPTTEANLVLFVDVLFLPQHVERENFHFDGPGAKLLRRSVRQEIIEAIE